MQINSKWRHQNKPPPSTPGPSTVDNFEINKESQLKYIFHDVTNRSSEKLAANSIFQGKNAMPKDPLMVTRSKKR